MPRPLLLLRVVAYFALAALGLALLLPNLLPFGASVLYFEEQT
jgi:hypothetical protein